ncbi:MAG: DNA repair protein RadA [Spirochaetaceae bacterium]|jgi:DNA repair protein RadA/Sms|nr:DNA repair protein RadA [Spirochaetaceae bacterium]
MKNKKKIVFRCSACGHTEPKWLGRCPDCGEWNTLLETTASADSASPAMGGRIARHEPPASLPLSSVEASEGTRFSSGIAELDRVLGGGIMRRSSVLIGGEPGIGKSTLLLQTAAWMPSNGRVLYISGEESAGQIKLRADRLELCCRRIEIFCSGNLEEITPLLESLKPVMVIVDSVQTLWTQEAGIIPGTINQMKYCSFELISWVKEHDAALFLVAHVTKDGVIAGPKTLEHMVDTVLYFEQSDTDSRFLRAAKNRFGSVDEIGIWTMGEKGLSAVEDPSLLFLVRREGSLPAGVATAAVLEGTRTLLVELQALTVPAKGAYSRVYSDRIDGARVARVAATLEKALGLELYGQDIYINVAGGLRVSEVGVELALAACIYSARTGIPLPLRTAITGELTLAAEVMPVRRLGQRIKTAKNLGFERFVGPGGDAEAEKEHPIVIKNLKEAIASLFSTAYQKPKN